ncbi:exopolysaccharide production protein ExoZ [Rhodanobacter sp. TND4EL1]
MKSDENKLEWIQALRGIAALMVVIVHSRFILQDTDAGKAVAYYVMYPMAMGVDLFFLISGFLMVLTTQNFDGTKGYAWRFMAKRIARIWPVYAVVSVAVVALEHHGLRGFRDLSTMMPFLEGLLFIPHDPEKSPLYFLMAVSVAWTLCFEFYFYLVFASSMLFGKRRYLAMATWFAITLVLIPVMRGDFTLGVSSQPTVAWWRYANLAINPIIWDFLFGMLAAWLYVSRVRIKSRGLIYGVMIALLAGIVINWDRLGLANFHGPGGWGLPLAIIFFGIVLFAKLGEIKVPAWSVWLGGISYSLYLVHLYAFEVTVKLVEHIPMAASTAKVVFFVLRPIVAVSFAALIYTYVETPSSHWMRDALLKLRFENKSTKSAESRKPIVGDLRPNDSAT